MDHMSGVLKNVNQTLENAYQLKTGKTEAELLSMLDAETWLTPEAALLHGFVDEILFGDQVQPGSSLAGRSKVASQQMKKMAAQLNLMKLKVGI